MGILILLPGTWIEGWVSTRTGLQGTGSEPLLIHYVNHAVMLLIAMLLITYLSRGHLSEYGLGKPTAKSYVGSALAWGILWGVLMTVTDSLPHFIANAPSAGTALTDRSIVGWVGFVGIVVGFAEEIPFRGLLQTFLMQRSSGRVRLMHYDMHIAGVIVALLFALAHVTTFWREPFWSAFGQQVYCFLLGILVAYWREKSGSLLAPIIGHNVSDLTEYGLMMLIASFGR